MKKRSLRVKQDLPKKVVPRHEYQPVGLRVRRRPCRDWILRTRKETFDEIRLDEFSDEAGKLLQKLGSHGDGYALPKVEERMTLQKMIWKEMSQNMDEIRPEEEIIESLYEGVKLHSMTNIRQNDHDRALDHACEINNEFHGPVRLDPLADIGEDYDTIIRICFFILFEDKKASSTSYRKASKIVLEMDVHPCNTLESAVSIAFDNGMLGYAPEVVVVFPTAIYGSLETITEMELDVAKFGGSLAVPFKEIPLTIAEQVYIRPQYHDPIGIICTDVVYRSCSEASAYPIVTSTWMRRFSLNVSRCHACMEWFPAIITKNCPYTLSNTYLQWCTECFKAWHSVPIKEGEIKVNPEMTVYPYSNRSIIRDAVPLHALDLPKAILDCSEPTLPLPINDRI